MNFKVAHSLGFVSVSVLSMATFSLLSMGYPLPMLEYVGQISATFCVAFTVAGFLENKTPKTVSSVKKVVKRPFVHG